MIRRPPRSTRVRSSAASDVYKRQDVERPEPGGLDGEEVAGDDAIRLRAEELGPRWAGPSWGRTRSCDPEQGPDRRCAHSEAELPELAFDPDTAPTGVLPAVSYTHLTLPTILRV